MLQSFLMLLPNFISLTDLFSVRWENQHAEVHPNRRTRARHWRLVTSEWWGTTPATATTLISHSQTRRSNRRRLKQKLKCDATSAKVLTSARVIRTRVFKTFVFRDLPTMHKHWRLVYPSKWLSYFNDAFYNGDQTTLNGAQFAWIESEYKSLQHQEGSGKNYNKMN